MKLFQLNIYGGFNLDKILDFVHKEKPDVVHFQEVTGGVWGHHPDVYSVLKAEKDYRISFAPAAIIEGDAKSYLGNATLYKKEYTAESVEIFFMNQMISYKEKPVGQFESYPRNGIDVSIKVAGTSVHFVNVHMVWGITPHDEPYKIVQHQKLIQYIQKTPSPWLLTGDFNITPDSNLVKSLNSLGKNLSESLDYPNTLNPNIHKAKHLFPKGLPVDYVYASTNVKIKHIRLVDELDLSDHYGYMVEFEI